MWGGPPRACALTLRCCASRRPQLARQNTSRKVKNHYEYVIIGAGTTAYAAIETIFNNKPDADLLLLSNEAVRGVAWATRGSLAALHTFHLHRDLISPPLSHGWEGREAGVQGMSLHGLWACWVRGA